MGKKHASHGGAWKVAYADFVTAMMALFMVLWISAQDQEILIATSKYFQNPFNAPLDHSVGVLEGSPGERQEQNEQDAQSLTEMTLLHNLAQEFFRLLDLDQTRTDSPVDVQVTNDGLRVTVFDRADHPLFVHGTAEFTEWGRFVVQNLAWLLARHDFKVRIEGHAAAGFDGPNVDYGPWELTTDRANATRRALEYYAVPAERIERVSGFGDTQPLPDTPPDAPRNDRIELSLVLLPPLDEQPR